MNTRCAWAACRLSCAASPRTALARSVAVITKAKAVTAERYRMFHKQGGQRTRPDREAELPAKPLHLPYYHRPSASITANRLIGFTTFGVKGKLP